LIVQHYMIFGTDVNDNLPRHSLPDMAGSENLV
jgi:hypothetical protein